MEMSQAKEMSRKRNKRLNLVLTGINTGIGGLSGYIGANSFLGTVLGVSVAKNVIVVGAAYGLATYGALTLLDDAFDWAERRGEKKREAEAAIEHAINEVVDQHTTPVVSRRRTARA